MKINRVQPLFKMLVIVVVITPMDHGGEIQNIQTLNEAQPTRAN